MQISYCYGEESSAEKTVDNIHQERTEIIGGKILSGNVFTYINCFFPKS